MKAVYCPYCDGRTKRNGRISSGSQRWMCTACGASATLRYDDTAARLGWLLSVTHNFFRKLTTAWRNTARAPSYDF